MKKIYILIILFFCTNPIISFASEQKFLEYFNKLPNDNVKGIACYYYAEQEFKTWEVFFILSDKHKEKYVKFFKIVESVKILLSKDNFFKIAETGYEKTKDIDFLKLDEKLSSYCLPKISILLRNYYSPKFVELEKQIILISDKINENRAMAKESCVNKTSGGEKLTCVVENIRKYVKGTDGL